MNTPNHSRRGNRLHFARAAAIFSLCLFACPGALGQGSDKPSVAAEPGLPPAKEIIGRFVKEIGGAQAIGKLDSQHLKGTFSMPAQGIEGKLEVFAAKPDKLLVNINLGGQGEISTGYNGKAAWMTSPFTGPMLLEGDMRADIVEQADFDSVLHDEKDYQSMETVRQTEFDGKPCYELKLVRKTGREVTEYYEVDSGLLVGFVALQQSQFGSILVKNSINEYKQYGDVRMPTKVTQELGPARQVMTIQSIEFNKVASSVFETPKEIRALIQ